MEAEKVYKGKRVGRPGEGYAEIIEDEELKRIRRRINEIEELRAAKGKIPKKIDDELIKLEQRLKDLQQ